MAGQRYAFDSFVLHEEAGTLTRHGVPIAVGYRALLLLAALVKRAGEVLTKSDLMDAAWPGATVEESNLSVQIASLRKLLGPGHQGSEWIATVPRIGYRFTAAIRKEDSAAHPGDHAAEPAPSIAVLPFANLGNEAEQQHFADGLAEDIITRLARLR